MAVLFDARGNEYTGILDAITGGTITDTRTLVANLAALNAETLTDLNGHSSAMVHLNAASNATLTVVFEGTIDGTNYFALPAFDISTQALVNSVALAAATIAKIFAIPCAGFKRIRTRVSAWTSGTIAVAQRATVGEIVPQYDPPFPTTLWVTATAAANTGVTATLPAVAGMFHYITHLDITRNATAALAGTATLVHTTTNLPGSPAWSVGNAMIAGGTQLDMAADFAVPLRSSLVNTATTVVMAAPGAAVLGRINVGYYVGP